MVDPHEQHEPFTARIVRSVKHLINKIVALFRRLFKKTSSKDETTENETVDTPDENENETQTNDKED